MWLILDSQVLHGHIFGVVVAIYTEWASILLVSANQSIIMEGTLNLPLIYICIKIGNFDDLYLIRQLASVVCITPVTLQLL